VINQALVVKKGHLYHKIKAEDIYFVESDKTYLTFHTCKEKFVRKGSLKKIMEMLDEFTFVRSHKSFLINLKHLKGIDTNNNIAIMNNNITIPISRRNKKTIETFWLEANRKKVV